MMAEVGWRLEGAGSVSCLERPKKKFVVYHREFFPRLRKVMIEPPGVPSASCPRMHISPRHKKRTPLIRKPQLRWLANYTQEYLVRTCLCSDELCSNQGSSYVTQSETYFSLKRRCRTENKRKKTAEMLCEGNRSIASVKTQRVRNGEVHDSLGWRFTRDWLLPGFGAPLYKLSHVT